MHMCIHRHWQEDSLVCEHVSVCLSHGLRPGDDAMCLHPSFSNLYVETGSVLEARHSGIPCLLLPFPRLVGAPTSTTHFFYVGLKYENCLCISFAYAANNLLSSHQPNPRVWLFKELLEIKSDF